ncbi:MAG: hypothetical protein IKZ61_11915 [Prevotella sp.]|nr:hypothetical protein [Prevotella sp.]
MPDSRRKEGGMSARYYTRRELMNMAVEEVYNPMAKWKYDEVITISSVRRYTERGWGDVSGNRLAWYATNYTGYHKTLDVMEGQRYKVKANSSAATTIIFCNDHVWASRKATTPAALISIPAGKERVVTVPSGYSYMMFRYGNTSMATVFLPERIARLVAYG